MGRFSKALLLALLLAVGGCATIGDMAGEQRIFGGTRLIGKELGEPASFGPCASCGPCWIFDLPLSLAADTLLLPVTITLAIVKATPKNTAKDSDAKEK